MCLPIGSHRRRKKFARANDRARCRPRRPAFPSRPTFRRAWVRILTKTASLLHKPQHCIQLSLLFLSSRGLLATIGAVHHHSKPRHEKKTWATTARRVQALPRSRSTTPSLPATGKRRAVPRRIRVLLRSRPTPSPPCLAAKALHKKRRCLRLHGSVVRSSLGLRLTLQMVRHELQK